MGALDSGLESLGTSGNLGRVIFSSSRCQPSTTVVEEMCRAKKTAPLV